jgi:hypothetical protein
MLKNQSNISVGFEHTIKTTYIGGHKVFPKQNLNKHHGIKFKNIIDLTRAITPILHT